LIDCEIRLNYNDWDNNFRAAKSTTEETSTMMEIFDTKSIEANKQGKKSEQQIKEIKEAVNPGVWLYGGLGILVFGGCFYAMVTSMDSGGAIGAFAVILAAVGVFAALRGLSIWNLRRKLLAEPVQTGEGTVFFKKQEGLGQITDLDKYVAETTDGKKLNPIGLAGVSAALPPGDYRFFYLKTRNWLLGVEPLFTEDELRNNLNELLADIFGYDKSFLEDCRKQAREGRLKVAEGLPKFSTFKRTPINEDDIVTEEVYCTIGDYKIQVSSRAAAAILSNIPHRIYHHADEGQSMAGIEVI
jgi:hypothetical protein